MESESNYGNIEYKRSLDHLDNEKIKSYAAQMKFRIKQSNANIAYYYIGLNDDGTIYGLNDIDTNVINQFQIIVDYAKCKIDDWWTIKDKNGSEFIKIIVSENNNIIESRILITGEKNTGKNTFISHCIYGVPDKTLVTRNNSPSIVNYHPFGYVTDTNVIYNYGNCDDINETKSLSDRLIYLINIPNDYKYIDKINFDQICTMHFIKSTLEINNNNNNIIYMIQDDNVEDYILLGNICTYNNYLSYDKLNIFICQLLKNKNKFIDNYNYTNEDDLLISDLFEYIVIVDVLYSYSNKKFLLLILSKIKNKTPHNIFCDIDNNICTIKSIQLEGTECQTISQYNRTYTIIAEFNTNFYKLKGRKFFISNN